MSTYLCRNSVRDIEFYCHRRYRLPLHCHTLWHVAHFPRLLRFSSWSKTTAEPVNHKIYTIRISFFHPMHTSVGATSTTWYQFVLFSRIAHKFSHRNISYCRCYTRHTTANATNARLDKAITLITLSHHPREQFFKKTKKIPPWNRDSWPLLDPPNSTLITLALFPNKPDRR